MFQNIHSFCLYKKNKNKSNITNIVILKTSENTRLNNNNDNWRPFQAQKMIDTATTVVRINKQITVPVTLEIHSSPRVFILNVVQTPRNMSHFKKYYHWSLWWHPFLSIIVHFNIKHVTKYSKKSRIYINFKI